MGECAELLRRQKRVGISEFLTDISAELSESELRLKYRLSLREMDEVFGKLVDAEFITKIELFSRYPAYKGRIDVNRQRQGFRVDLTIPLSIIDLKSKLTGIVRDISRHGFRTAGIEAEVGETGAFRIPVDIFLNSDPLVFSADCAWVDIRGSNRKYTVAGFRLKTISDADAQVLENLVHLLVFDGSKEQQRP